MSNFFIKKFGKSPVVNNGLLILGLPGIGNVARISVEYLIEKLKARKFLEVFSDVFPNSVMINDDSTVKLFSVEFFYARVGGFSLILVSGDVQPSSDIKSYALCIKLISLIKQLRVKRVITIGGIGFNELPDKPRVHCVFNCKSLIKKFGKSGVVVDGNDTVKLILGAAGLVLGLAGINGIKGFSLLAETLNHPNHAGIKESREVLKVLSKFLGFKLDLKELDDDIKSYDKELKGNSKIISEINECRDKQRYIG